jgi:RNA recognition motif-containing protein
LSPRSLPSVLGDSVAHPEGCVLHRRCPRQGLPCAKVSHVAACSVVEVYLPADRETGRLRELALVQFASESEAGKAIQRSHDREVEGRRLTVNPAGADPHASRGRDPWIRITPARERSLRTRASGQAQRKPSRPESSEAEPPREHASP